MFTIRKYGKNDRGQVGKIVLELAKYYPGIKTWLEKPGGELDKLDKDQDFCLIADVEGKIAGISVSSLTRSPSKNDAVKLKTFYVPDEFQGLAIGNPLLEATIDHWAREKAKKIYVTMSGEEFPGLRGYFQKYGFMFCGVSPCLYRDESKEYFMNKDMRYGKISLKEHTGFILKNLFENYGFSVEKISDHAFMVKKNDFFSIPVRSIVAFCPVPDQNCAGEAASLSDKNGCGFSFLISEKPAGQKVREEFKGKLAFVDFLYMETLFYPLVFERQGDAGFVQPIRKEYSSQLFLDISQPTLAVPPKKQMRSDKAYYMSQKSANRMSRGQTIVFYESEPTSAIVGEGRVKDVEVGTPEELFGKYGGHGVLSQDELRKIADETGKLMVISFSRTVLYPKKVRPEAVGMGTPQSAIFLNDKQLTEIREKGGYFG